MDTHTYTPPRTQHAKTHCFRDTAREDALFQGHDTQTRTVSGIRHARNAPVEGLEGGLAEHVRHRRGHDREREQQRYLRKIKSLDSSPCLAAVNREVDTRLLGKGEFELPWREAGLLNLSR